MKRDNLEHIVYGAQGNGNHFNMLSWWEGMRMRDGIGQNVGPIKHGRMSTSRQTARAVRRPQKYSDKRFWSLNLLTTKNLHNPDHTYTHERDGCQSLLLWPDFHGPQICENHRQHPGRMITVSHCLSHPVAIRLSRVSPTLQNASRHCLYNCYRCFYR